MHISNKPCQCPNTDFLADYTPGTSNNIDPLTAIKTQISNIVWLYDRELTSVKQFLFTEVWLQCIIW